MTKLNKLIESDDSKKILVVDTYNLIFRTIHIAESQNKKFGLEDESFSYWKYLFVKSIFNMVKQFDPDTVVMATDTRNTWRKQYYSEYKAQRKAARDSSKIDFEKFFPILNEYLIDLKQTLTNIVFLDTEGCEGDDIIAAIAQNDRRSNIIIVSTDGDLHQLLKYKNVKQYDPMKKKYINSLNPVADLEIKILTGDRGDNIPGVVKKCGEVKAASILLNDKLNKLFEREDHEKILNEKEDKVDKLFDGYKIKDIQEAYRRNRVLIDLSFIPKEIQEKIMDEFKEYPTSPLNTRKLLNVAVKHRLPTLIDTLQDVKNLFRKIEGDMG